VTINGLGFASSFKCFCNSLKQQSGKLMFMDIFRKCGKNQWIAGVFICIEVKIMFTGVQSCKLT
jgi:hypothetical protein